MSYRERVAQFGEGGHLFGILCLPSGETLAGAPTVLMINAGIIHHVGVSRLHVEAARELAAAGIPSLRFDLSGIGESDPRPTAPVSLQEGVDADLADALAYVRSLGHQSHHALVGLCSGAHDALLHAEHDEDTVGVFAIDVIGSFANKTHRLNHIRRRMADPVAWARLRAEARRRGDPLNQGATEGGSPGLPQGVRQRFSHEGLDGLLERLLGRGVQLSFVFTDGLEDNYNYEGQFRDNHEVAADARCGSHFLPGSDHLLTEAGHRRAVVEEMLRWARSLATD